MGTCFSLPSFPLCLPQHFPGQPLVQNFLHSVNDWLKRQQRKKIPYSFFKAALDNRKEVSLAETEHLLRILSNCGGGRGSSCSLCAPSPPCIQERVLDLSRSLSRSVPYINKLLTELSACPSCVAFPAVVGVALIPI